MKLFNAFVIKEFKHILRDWRTLLIVVLIPVIQIILFGFALSTEIHQVRFAVLTPQPDEMTRSLIQQIEASTYFTFTGYLQSDQQVTKQMQKGNVDIVIRIESTLDRALLHRDSSIAIQLIVDAANPVNATTESSYLQSIILQFLQTQALKGNFQIQNYQISPILHMLYNPQMLSAYNFVPGIMGLIFILIAALMTSVSIVREKETGSMELLRVSPVPSSTIILAKMIPFFVISCLNLAIILFLAYFLLKVPMQGNLFTLVVISQLYIILSLALGLLISTIAPNQTSATLLSFVGLLFPIIMLSGMMFPIENMPKFLQYISCIVPARWYISAIRKLMIQGVTIQYVIKEMMILLAMTLGLLAIAIRKTNRNR